MHKLPKRSLRLLTGARAAFLYLAEPFDYISRVVNGKTQFPPLFIRRYAGPLSGLESSGAEFLAYMKLLCRVPASARVLDIGCGFGLMALYLKDYLKHPGSYTGVDIDQRAIKWARAHVNKKYPHIRFIDIDIRNSAYNPRGRLNAADVKFPLDRGTYDFVLLKSVFTHMLREEVANYLKEVARLLAPGGTCLMTLFILNETQLELQARGLNSIRFEFADGDWRYAYREMPELAVAYKEEYVLNMLREAGLAVQGIYNGSWSGRDDGVSYQDMVVVQKP